MLELAQKVAKSVDSITTRLCETLQLAGGLTLAKIVYKISKSFDFIEIKMISSDFSNDFSLQKSIKYVGNLTKF